jgi:hypothetical protein
MSIVQEDFWKCHHNLQGHLKICVLPIDWFPSQYISWWARHTHFSHNMYAFIPNLTLFSVTYLVKPSIKWNRISSIVISLSGLCDSPDLFFLFSNIGHIALALDLDGFLDCVFHYWKNDLVLVEQICSRTLTEFNHQDNY